MQREYFCQCSAFSEIHSVTSGFAASIDVPKAKAVDCERIFV
jgi:hypothetical protein